MAYRFKRELSIKESQTYEKYLMLVIVSLQGNASQTTLIFHLNSLRLAQSLTQGKANSDEDVQQEH